MRKITGLTMTSQMIFQKNLKKAKSNHIQELRKS